MAEFVAYAKQRPGKILYATNAIGSFPHFDSEILARRAGIDMVHVPVKGGPPDFMKDMITGDVHVAFVNAASSAGFIRGGQLRALAAVSEQRLAEFPDVPTMAEVGFPGVGTQLWSAMTAPAGTPREMLETLNAAVTKALNSETLKEAYKKQSVIPAPTPSLAATQEWLKGEVAKWNGIINEVKIEIPE
jgi:tripartite-type tricarboxylate transporter receptor subunit TctC